MYPSILESKEVSGIWCHATDSDTVFTAFELALLDLEVSDLHHVDESISQFLKTLTESATARIWLNSKASFEDLNSDYSRRDAIDSLGFVINRLYLVIERHSSNLKSIKTLFKSSKSKRSFFDSLSLNLLSSFDLEPLKSAGIRIRSLDPIDVEPLFPEKSLTEYNKLRFGVDAGKELIGVVRLVKQASNPISLLTLSHLKDSLPLPFEIRNSVRKLSREKSEIELRRRVNQTKSGSDRISNQKFQESENQLEDVALFGGDLFQFEFLILLPRGSEETLRRDCDLLVQKLRPLGDFDFETFGAGESYLASNIGFKQHVTLLESDQILPSFLPMITSGSSSVHVVPRLKRDLVLQRRDQSLFGFDLFNHRYDNFSVNIIGKSGRGKSVLTNLLTRALHYDPNVSIIKVDVGGSHSKETKLLNGLEKSLTLNTPSGINPFSSFKDLPHSEDICNVIGSFINVLLMEEGETFLSKSMRAEIERLVSGYSLSRPLNPSIQDFYDFARELPRRDLLSRWTDRGVFKYAFMSSGEADPKSNANRLKYFNFSQIFQANDPDFGQGGLAAVMAQFNLDMMRLKNQRLVFIADETPFFVERCFSFFKFSTANVRKFGGSFITVAQKSADLVIGGDSGILENSAQKFLFSIDGERESFAKRLKLEEDDLRKIESLKSRKGSFSEVLLQDLDGTRTLKIELTPDEYWALTSSQDDNEKISKLLSAVPNLSLTQAIKILSEVEA